MLDRDDRSCLIEQYLRHLEHSRLPSELPRTREDAQRILEEMESRNETDPYFEAWEELHDLVYDDPEAAFDVIVTLLARCDERDLGALGAGPMETLLWRHAAAFAERFEELILTDGRFREAFEFVRMGGVPLSIQRRLNAALIRTGVDPTSLIEFDEHADDEEEAP